MNNEAKIFDSQLQKKEQETSQLQIAEIIAKEEYGGKYELIKKYINSGHDTEKDFLELLRVTRKNSLTQLAVFENIHNISNPKEIEKILRFILMNTVDFEDMSDERIYDGMILSEEISASDKQDIADHIPSLASFLDKKDGHMFARLLYLEMVFWEMEKLGDVGEDVVISYLQNEIWRQNHEPYDSTAVEMKGSYQGQDTGSYMKDDVDEYGDPTWGVKDDEGDMQDTDAATMYDVLYLEKKNALDHLAKFGSKKSVDFAISFFEQDYNAVFLYKDLLAEILSRYPEYAAEKLFAIINSSSKFKDKQSYKDALKLLCRIELGRIGISEEGIKYFEALYDVGEFNNPDYFAQRLTGDGNIGIFDNQRERYPIC